MNRIIVYDNGEESYDHFTIIDTKTGDMYGASDEPSAPNGFGQHCGNLVESYLNITYGISHSKPTPTHIREIMTDQISKADGDVSWLGVRIQNNRKLPIGVRNYIKLIIS